MSSTVKSPSSFEGQTNSSEQLNAIFQSIKAQINQWGEKAKWKIDLLLLDNPSLDTLHTHPSISPIAVNNTGLPITSTIQYPWDYVAPKKNDYTDESDDLHQKLRVSLERQMYLESIIKSQAEQIKNSGAKNYYNENAINTMKNIFLMSQNEQKIHYLKETSSMQKDIDILSKKLKKMASFLEKIEKFDLLNIEKESLDKDSLLNERKILLKKLYLAQLRLTARDAEINYLNEMIDTYKTNYQEFSRTQSASPRPYIEKKLKKGPPYLLQQQYSPRNEVKSSDQYHLSPLDSLGFVADQMLSDPEFENSTHHEKQIIEKRLRSRIDDHRSQRSIDSAATLLAMPQLMNPTRTTQEESKSSMSPSPESYKLSAFDHMPKKPRSTYTRWTESEDKLLRKAVKQYGHSNWEACAKEISGRSNVQCRNRWIRHLEHRSANEDEESNKIQLVQTTKASNNNNTNNARHSPSIASLLNTTNDNDYRYSPKALPRQLYKESGNSKTSHLLPSYRPPSPIATPEKRKAPESSNF